jgi:hypothetical protein
VTTSTGTSTPIILTITPNATYIPPIIPQRTPSGSPGLSGQPGSTGGPPPGQPGPTGGPPPGQPGSSGGQPSGPSGPSGKASTTSPIVPDTLNVLTYNVSWEAMTALNNKKHSGSAKAVADLCEHISTDKTNDNTNQCLINVAQVIDNTPNETTDLDFVGLQEATNWEIIITKSKKLQKMKYIHHNIIGYDNTTCNHTDATEDLISFYNPNKFTLIAFKIDLIKTRPYQIIYLKLKSTDEIYAFINVHLPHYASDLMQLILNKFSYTTTNIFVPKTPDNFNYFSNNAYIYNQKCKTKYPTDVEKYKLITDYTYYTNTTSLKHYEEIFKTTHIIFLGDTNYQDKLKFYSNEKRQYKYLDPQTKNTINEDINDFKPFAYIDPTKITDKTFSNDAKKFKDITMKPIKPLNTCCNSGANQTETYKEENGNNGNIADYILISTGLEYADNSTPNKIPTFLTSKPNFGVFPTSDHLPVYATIKIPKTALAVPSTPATYDIKILQNASELCTKTSFTVNNKADFGEIIKSAPPTKFKQTITKYNDYIKKTNNNIHYYFVNDNNKEIIGIVYNGTNNTNITLIKNQTKIYGKDYYVINNLNTEISVPFIFNKTDDNYDTVYYKLIYYYLNNMYATKNNHYVLINANANSNDINNYRTIQYDLLYDNGNKIL